jgi:hypothetical protein
MVRKLSVEKSVVVIGAPVVDELFGLGAFSSTATLG